MNAEIICVASDSMPDEHSSTVCSYISKKLFELGHRTVFESVCPYVKETVEKLIKQGISRSDLIIIIGGIEPETGFVSKKALSAVTGYPIVAGKVALETVKDYCVSINCEATAEQLSAATVLRDSTVFKNDIGLCCGMAVEYDSKMILLLPSAEGELSHMFETKVSPILSIHGINVTRTVNVIGLSLPEIENKLSRLSERSEYALTLAERGAEAEIGISVVASSLAEAESLCSKAVSAVTIALGKYVYAVDSNGIQYETVRVLREKELTVATAESCTGGLVSEMLTEVSGSSCVFEYGISAYSNRIKSEVLRVPESIIEKAGAVSQEVAIHMARNVRENSGATLGVAITGNAGPTASEGKPVGLVFVAMADKDSYTVVELNLPTSYDRDKIRTIAATTALNLVRKYASSYPIILSDMKKLDIIPSSAPAFSEAPAPVVETTHAVEVVVQEESASVSESDVSAKAQTAYTSPEQATNSEEDKFEAAPLEAFNYSLIFDREDEDSFDEELAKEYRFAEKKKVSVSFGSVIEKIGAAFKNFIPFKGDSVKTVILKCVFLLSVIGLITSSTVIFTQITADNKQLDIINEAQSKWNFDGEKLNDDTYAAFEPFTEKNEEIVGWLTVPGTKVDNPVCQTTDNDYYLNHNIYKEKSRYGALFFDYRCIVTGNNISQNTIIYGHEMKDGSMFGTLKNYKNLNFYKTNPTFTLTRQDRHSTYKIFAVMIMNAKPSDDNGYMFNYIQPSFASAEKFNEWIKEARERSLINTDVDIESYDNIVTLVTCINDFNDARLVIMARETRAFENATVQTSSASLNPNPRYPQAWYDKRGLEGYTSASSEDVTTSSEIPSSDIHSSEEASSDQPSSDNSSSSQGSSSDTPSTSEPTPSTPESTDTPSTPASSSDTSSGESAPASSEVPSDPDPSDNSGSSADETEQNPSTTDSSNQNNA